MDTLRKDLSLSAIIAGFIAVIISYAGPLIIVFQAAREAALMRVSSGTISLFVSMTT